MNNDLRLIKESTVRIFVREQSEDAMRIAGDFLVALNEEVKFLICKAIVRAAASDRKTLRAHDV